MNTLRNLWKYKRELAIVGTVGVAATYVYQRHLKESALFQQIKNGDFGRGKAAMIDLDECEFEYFESSLVHAQETIQGLSIAWCEQLNKTLTEQIPAKPNSRDADELMSFFRHQLSHLISSFTGSLIYFHLRVLFSRLSFVCLCSAMRFHKNPFPPQMILECITFTFAESSEPIVTAIRSNTDRLVGSLSTQKLINFDCAELQRLLDDVKTHLVEFVYTGLDLNLPNREKNKIESCLNDEVNTLRFKQLLASAVVEHFTIYTRPTMQRLSQLEEKTFFNAVNTLTELLPMPEESLNEISKTICKKKMDANQTIPTDSNGDKLSSAAPPPPSSSSSSSEDVSNSKSKEYLIDYFRRMCQHFSAGL